MLFVSLIASAALWLIAHRIVRRSEISRDGDGLYQPGLHRRADVLGTSSCPPVIFQAPLLYVAMVVWRGPHRKDWPFLPFSCTATLLAYACAAVVVHRVEKELHLLRSPYPYVTMERSLPKPKPMAAGARRTPASEIQALRNRAEGRRGCQSVAQASAQGAARGFRRAVRQQSRLWHRADGFSP